MSNQSQDAPRGLSGRQLAVSQDGARKVMSTSQSPKITADSPGPRLNSAIQTLRKYGVKP
jgi:hypothetical protein